MPDPLDTNDDWAELARELERDKPAPDPVEEPRDEFAEVADAHTEEAATEGGEAEAAGDEEIEDGEDGATGEDGEQPGTGRKRRRRRRRRRKGGTPAEGESAGVPVPADEDAVETDGEAVAESDGEVEAGEYEDADAEPALIGTEEDTASDVLRELIATWDVPSWGEIVDGLHRPN